jgi:hypothetical protein
MSVISVCLSLVVAALFVVILVLVKPDRTPLVGFWEADDIFKEDASLSDAYMYIGCRSDDGSHPSYILFANDDGDVIMNQSMKTMMDYSTLRKNWSWSTDIPSNDVLPPNMNMEYNASDGVIELFKDGTLYAKFIKNNKLSHMCKPAAISIVDEELQQVGDTVVSGNNCSI